MGVTVDVRDFRGQTLLRGLVDMRGMLAAAEGRGLPLLSGVDVYDDTTFNRRQSVLLKDEVGVLVGPPGDELAEAVECLKVAVELVNEAPHRYLVFNGD